MPRAGNAARVTIHLDGAVLWHQRPAYAELVHRARHEGLAGASVFHGFTGFGADRCIHRERPAHLAAKGPCAVVLVDDEDRLRFFLLCAREVLEQTEAVVVLDRVRIQQAGAPAVP